MSEIPDDIRKAANNIMDEACLPMALYDNGVDARIRQDIAKALLAEREAQRDRDAKIAETGYWSSSLGSATGKAVAAAICAGRV